MRTISICLRRFGPGFLFVTLLCAGLSAWSEQDPAAGPLTEEQILSLVTSAKLGELPASRVSELVRKRGIAFPVTDVFLLELQTRQADPALLETLRQIRGQGKDFVPTIAAGSSGSLGPSSTPEGPVPPTSTGAVEADWPKFLEQVRAKAIAYTDELPNFICTQLTQRSARYFPGGWRTVDNFVAELSYFDKKEHYKILTVANQATTTATIENLSGTRSTGEFGSSMRTLFEPATNAAFRLEGREQTNGRETIRLGYQVARETSSRSINYNNERTIITAYRGRCWIDPESFQVVRLEDKAINIPPDFPITRSDGSTDYDLADIGGRKYWLPVRAEVLLVEGGAKLHTRNVIEFKRYRKFEAEVRIVPD
jgi:hypothetical protein